MQNTHSYKFLKKRKFLLVLPLLTVPFITLAFWAISSSNNTDQNDSLTERQGLNFRLPDARLIDGANENKLSFYNKAQEDSIKLRLEKQNDPYYKNGLDTLYSDHLTSRA